MINKLFDWIKSLFANKYPDPVPAPAKPIENVAPVALSVVKKRCLGIDTSHYEPVLDYVAAKKGGVEWVITKATEGTHHVDALLHQHINAAKSAGCLVGAYLFFHAAQDAKDQLDHYLNTVKGMSLDFPHCLDWESSSADGVAPAIQKAKARVILDGMEKASGKVPIIYGGLSFLKELHLDPEFARYPLWLAHYGVSSTVVPSPWKEYWAWQWSDAGSVPGLKFGHHVDVNWFNGSVDELHAFANRKS